jgi:hypothetical protein
VNWELIRIELRLNYKLTKSEFKLKVIYKFIASHGWTFKWMNPMTLAYVTHIIKYLKNKFSLNLASMQLLCES